MKELKNIFYNVSHSSDKWEPYLEIYERHLKPFVGKNVDLVEVGVQKGGSLEMWSEYLGPQSNVTGIDIDPECSKLRYDQNNIRVIIGDQGDETFWNSCLLELGEIDIFIDDGGHFMDQQILTFEKIFPVMKVGGIYMCEDCHTSYMAHNGGELNKSDTFIEYAKTYIDVINYDWISTKNADIDSKHLIAKDLSGIFIYDSVVVFEKFGKRSMNRVKPNKFQ